MCNKRKTFFTANFSQRFNNGPYIFKLCVFVAVLFGENTVVSRPFSQTSKASEYVQQHLNPIERKLFRHRNRHIETALEFKKSVEVSQPKINAKTLPNSRNKVDEYSNGARTTFSVVNNLVQPVTGRLDANRTATKPKPQRAVQKVISSPTTESLGSRQKRYVIQGSRWDKSVVTFRVASYSKKLSRVQVDKTIAMAFRKWAEVVPLVFRPSTSNDSDISILFAEGDHGCAIKFDGQDGIVAHAFFPQFGGDIHFDDAEDWTTSTNPSPAQKSLLKTAVHEVGHSLGLRHSQSPSAVMRAPDVNGEILTPNLHDDDVEGIQMIYGRCETSFDAIEVWSGNFNTYVFKKNVYWRLDDTKRQTSPNYPQRMSNWRGVPDQIDDVLLWGHNWQTYFFKGDKYYKYKDIDDVIQHIEYISAGWSGVPDNIDAAFTHSDYKTYFFKGNLVYQFDNTADRVASGYPKNITDVFPGLPNELDTAFRWYYDAISYFFKGLEFWYWSGTMGKAVGPYNIKDNWKNHCFV